MEHIKKVTVFCGSSMGSNPTYIAETQALGKALAEQGIQTIFGGYKGGQMGVLAKAVVSHGGKVISVYPESLSLSGRFEKASQTHISKTLQGQRNIMRKFSDAFIAMPGSINTLSELFEQASMNDHNALTARNRIVKPIIICSTFRYYENLEAQIERSVADGFMKPEQTAMLHFVPSAQKVIEKLIELDQAPQMKAGQLRPKAI